MDAWLVDLRVQGHSDQRLHELARLLSTALNQVLMKPVRRYPLPSSWLLATRPGFDDYDILSISTRPQWFPNIQLPSTRLGELQRDHGDVGRGA